jgi:hypothetical protein
VFFGLFVWIREGRRMSVDMRFDKNACNITTTHRPLSLPPLLLLTPSPGRLPGRLVHSSSLPGSQRYFSIIHNEQRVQPSITSQPLLKSCMAYVGLRPPCAIDE